MLKQLKFALLFGLLISGLAIQAQITVYGLSAINLSPDSTGVFDNYRVGFMELNPYDLSFEIKDTLTAKAVAVGSSTFDSNNNAYLFKGQNENNGFSLYYLQANNGSIIYENADDPGFVSANLELEYDMQDGATYGLRWDFESQTEYVIKVDVETGESIDWVAVPGVETILLNATAFNSNSRQYLFLGQDENYDTRLYAIDVVNQQVVSSPLVNSLGNAEMKYDNLNDRLLALNFNMSEYELVEVDILTGDLESNGTVENLKAIFLGSSTFAQDSTAFIFQGIDDNNVQRLYVINANDASTVADNPITFSVNELQVDNTSFANKQYLLQPEDPNNTALLEKKWTTISPFPNPSSSGLVEINNSTDENLALQTFGMDGKLLYSQVLLIGDNRIDLAQLSSGNYLLVITNGKGAKQSFNWIKN